MTNTMHTAAGPSRDVSHTGPQQREVSLFMSRFFGGLVVGH